MITLIRLRVIPIIIIISVIQVQTIVAQSFHLTGTISERATGEAIPGATLWIIGTSHGAKANVEGRYKLELERGQVDDRSSSRATYSIRVTAIGYRPDTLHISLTSDSVLNISLATAPVIGTPITISADASRTEARRIMHKVIDTKDAWQSQIHDYRFEAYSRLGVRQKQDTTAKVIAILESVADGFWKRDAGYAEKITARKQTANLPSDVNRVALFGI